MEPPSNNKSSTDSILAWLLIAIAVFLVRIMPWALSEFWYDEVLTFTEFVLGGRREGIWESVFRCYPIANNHILSTAVYWCWVRVLNFGFSAEQIVRLPSILFGCCTIAIIICHWRKWLGNKLAILGGIAIAISPIFTAYAYQVRGYSLSMLLATAAISGALETVDGKRIEGEIILCLSSLLLPLTIPSNVLIIPALAIAIWLSCSSIKERLAKCAPCLISTAIGGCYYFTIWEQFVKASKEPGGWHSAWLVLGNLLLAFTAHALVLIVAYVFYRFRKQAKTEANSETPDSTIKLKKWPYAIALTSLLTIAAILLVSRSGHAPYPRVFLVFLPLGTIAVLLPLSTLDRFAKTSFPLLVVLLLANGLLWERISTTLADREITEGKSPSNLLQQYYRGSDGLREAAMIFRDEGWMENACILTDEYDWPTMNFYWLMLGGHPHNVFTINTVPTGFWQQIPMPRPRVWAVAKTPNSAARLFEHAGLGKADDIIANYGKDGGMKLITYYGKRGIYLPPFQIPPQLHKHKQKQPIPNARGTMI